MLLLKKPSLSLANASVPRVTDPPSPERYFPLVATTSAKLLRSSLDLAAATFIPTRSLLKFDPVELNF